METDSNIVFIVREDKKVGNLSRSRVVLAPNQLTADELHEYTRSLTVNEIIRDYPASEVENLNEVDPTPPTTVVISETVMENNLEPGMDQDSSQGS